jgi:phage protein D
VTTQPLQAAYASRPIVRIGPRYVEVQAHLQHLSLEDSAGGLATLELRLDSVVTDTAGRAAHPYDDDQILSLGAEVYLGMADQDRPQHSMFRGRVTGIEAVWGEGSPSVVVLVEDQLQRLRMTRRTKVHDNLRLTSLVEELCRDLELRHDVVGFDDSLGTQVQLNESDLAFLRRLVHERDGELQLVEGTLQIRKVSELRRGTVQLDVAQNRLRCRIRADLAHQVSEVTLSGWDVAQGRRIAATSQFTATGPGQGTDGAAMLQRALRTSRKEHLAHVPVLDQNEAQAVVDAMHARRARQFVTLEATAPGDPRLRVGAQVELAGAGDRFDNTYLIVQTHHRMDRVEGYETTFLAECAFLGAP